MKTLIVFARAPELGRVKTRLARTLGDARALALYRAFLDDVCALASSGVADRVLLAVAGAIDHADLPSGIERIAQAEGDLGARMHAAIARFSTEGPVCIVGTDSPALERAWLSEAFLALARVDVTLGPTLDGGYWLIGARRPLESLFEHIAWSTPSVLPETLRRLQSVSHHLLPAHFDVDDERDLDRLRDELLARPQAAPRTRAALLALGVLR